MCVCVCQPPLQALCKVWIILTEGFAEPNPWSWCSESAKVSTLCLCASMKLNVWMIEMMLSDKNATLFHCWLLLVSCNNITSSVKLLTGLMISIIYSFSWRETAIMNDLKSLIQTAGSLRPAVLSCMRSFGLVTAVSNLFFLCINTRIVLFFLFLSFHAPITHIKTEQSRFWTYSRPLL